jgi:GpV Apex motif
MGISQKTPFASSINTFVDRKINDFQQQLGQVLPCHVTAVNGAIVTVNFDVLAGELTIPPVTCPIAESTYVRLPIQVGDYGICISANTRLGGISGLGLGKAPLAQPANLGGLVFMPIGNKNWSAVDPKAVNINAPNGAVIRDTNNNCVITLTPSGVITTIGGTTFTINGTSVTAVNGNSTIFMDANNINFTAPNINLNGVIGLNGPFTQHTNTHGTTGYIIGPLEVLNDLTSDATITGSTDVKTGSGISLKTHKHGGVQTGGGQTGIPV